MTVCYVDSNYTCNVSINQRALQWKDFESQALHFLYYQLIGIPFENELGGVICDSAKNIILKENFEQFIADFQISKLMHVYVKSIATLQ